MLDLTHCLERTVVIRATPETVFRFFTDSSRWAAWWGAGSTIDAQPGGKMYIRHPNGVETVGEVVEVQSPRRIVFSYGYATGKPIPPGSSRVTISLEPAQDGTRLHLLHAFAEPGPRDEHVQGWCFQLAVFANIVANEAHSSTATAVDGWFEAWAIADGDARKRKFAEVVTPQIRFRDRYSLLDGMDDLIAHTSAALRFMPGISLKRRGEVRHCQGTVLADWVTSGSDGAEKMNGTSVFEFGADGRIVSAVSFANP